MMRRLIEAVADDPKIPWSDETRRTTFVSDANAILESLLLSYGIEAALKAVVEKGYSPDGNYRYAVERLHAKALERRAERIAKQSHKANSPD
jgi:hypothetical protein